MSTEQVVDAKKTKIDETAAWQLLKDAGSIAIAKGKKVHSFTSTKTGKDEILTTEVGQPGYRGGVGRRNRDLQQMVNDGSFRQDLFYRLNVFPLELPSLRERVQDIPPLLKRFTGNTFLFSPECIDLLKSHNWPGNIRELENLIERLVILTQKTTIDVEDLHTSLGEFVTTHQQIRSVTVAADRVGRRVFQQQQVVLCGAAVDTTLPESSLQVPRLGIRQSAEPSDPEHRSRRHASSCSQSQVSRFCLIFWRN